jgi:hypothetical protein
MIILSGFLFHFANAMVRGLNMSLCSSLGLYPALIWSANRLCQLIDGSVI